MERRTFLRWAVHGMGAVFATVLGVPAVAFVLDPRNRPADESGFKRVARFQELPVGVPREVVIRETRRDAWTLHPDEIVGRVWLVRREGTRVDAFTTTCPHLGCSVNFTGTQFLCPCHGGRFTLDGRRVDPNNNPAPRDMDALKHPDDPDEENPRLVRIPGTPEAEPDYEVWVKFYKFKTNQATKELLV